MSGDPDAYPMPAYTTLAVRDLRRSTRWYADVLGFAIVYEFPNLVHIRWTRYADILLVRDENGAPSRKGAGVTLGFQGGPRGVDAVAVRAAAGGAAMEGPVDRPWNVRELVVTDPDGYRLMFTDPIDTRVSMEELIAAWIDNEARDAPAS